MLAMNISVKNVNAMLRQIEKKKKKKRFSSCNYLQSATKENLSEARRYPWWFTFTIISS